MPTQNIYQRVLEIGSECLECGISFNQLKERLKEEGFETENDCLDRCLREWFFNSFFHEEMVCDHGNMTIHTLKDHYGCNFILKAETCLRILSYEEAEKSNQLVEQLTQQTALYQYQVQMLQSQLSLAQTSIENSEKDSKSARSFAIWALILSAIFGVLGIFDALTYFGINYREEDKKYESTILQSQEQQLLKQDSLLKSINQIHNDIKVYSLQSKVSANKKVYSKRP
ncbi:hypothetical protein [Flavobacterium covae]|uniref:hypothetical protein n=1 Tax=Flavobacterium covae TaxID=2906076 RepID=UPI000745AEDA|nr:hypothetical protein [Flavobacterium covae]AMA49468.1 hypothetical protein AWN65_08345 [Flavobacterium covae]MCJ1808925.1 hypothetical protein [Flavobacterium covae]